MRHLQTAVEHNVIKIQIRKHNELESLMTLKLITIYITVGSILINIGIFLYYSLSLYESSQEKSRIGYVKYLEILKLDILPGENTALIFEGERLKRFLKFRVLMLVFTVLLVVSLAVRIIFL